MSKDFLLGATSALCAIAGLFFFRFWTMTHDRFFLIFASAFWVLALQWMAQAVLEVSSDSRHYSFVVRLLAFLLIILAIVEKNRRP